MNVYSIRSQYEQYGVDEYYSRHGSNYENPHMTDISQLLEQVNLRELGVCHVWDLCCGSGEVSEHVLKQGIDVTASDPYTIEAYRKRIGKLPYSYKFIDICSGEFDQIPQVDMIICSYALHLCPLYLQPALYVQLSQVSHLLLVISPNKNTKVGSGWELQREWKVGKARGRLYRFRVFADKLDSKASRPLIKGCRNLDHFQKG